MRRVRVVFNAKSSIVARLDEQNEIRTPVPGNQSLRAGSLDLADIRRKVLRLAERHQLVADNPDLRPEFREEAFGIAFQGLTPEVVLVEQVYLPDLRRQCARQHHSFLIRARVESEMPEAALLVSE